MSPRSTEFLAAAREHLAGARPALDTTPSVALGAAYYSMFYAERAALSEREVYARTHRGTWFELRKHFVLTGILDEGLVARVHEVQSEREEAAYDGWAVPADEGRRVVALAEEFLAAIERALG